MKIKVLVLVIFFLFATSVVNAIDIEINVPKILTGKVNYFHIKKYPKVVKFSTEFYNTGSVAYKTRVRLDVSNSTHRIFTGWGKEKILMPGDKKKFVIYFSGNITGNFIGKPRFYFGNEIMEYDEINFGINESSTSEDIFEIREFRTYDRFVVFDLKSRENADDVFIIPHGYTDGWIFEQQSIDSIEEGGRRTIKLDYDPTLWSPDDLILIVASKDGKYFTEKKVELRKEGGLLWLVHYIVDNLKIYSNKL